jgi:hypothetical protein
MPEMVLVGGELREATPEEQELIEADRAAAALAAVRYAGQTPVDAQVRTTDATPTEVFRFPASERHLYQASLTVSGIDAGSFVTKVMEGRFVWKRLTADAIVVGITVVSDIHNTAAAAWAPNCQPSGSDIVFTVQGASGRTVDWYLSGSVSAFAPDGLTDGF